jgi:predicted CoA-substrate-specific enzyme activase
MLRDGAEAWVEVVSHEGDIRGTLVSVLERRGVAAGVRTLVTGGAGRNQVAAAKVVLPEAVEAAAAGIEHVDAIVSLGGETLVVYAMKGASVATALMGDKCAAGTGEFFRQQLGRMAMTLEDSAAIPDDTRVHPVSARCSVFMKSDCTHKLNKREATREEIAVSLAAVMAEKVGEFLGRARISRGRVLLIGGVTNNRFVRRFLAERFPEIEFVVPPQAAHFEALGAAALAARHGSALPPVGGVFSESAVNFERFPALRAFSDRVSYLPARHGGVRAGGVYALGIDGGSTTTKAVLVDMETKEICASCYDRTHGDPVRALKGVLAEILRQVREQIGDAPIRIPLASTTGSGREVLGVFVATPAVYNEIIAHTEGTTFFRPGIDTIFEIGGQDAKYVYLRNGVPVDYAMNEACSAGTGSFLEESARGDLNVRNAPEIGPVALESVAPLKFGEHCSAFINSDVRKAIQEGATRPDIMAGIVFSIVTNYLNRVVGNRQIGGRVVLQGGVAKNPAVPLAFAAMLGREICVPPDPELLGAFGVALLAIKRAEEGTLARGEWALDELVSREIAYGASFKCKACENRCPIRVLEVAGKRFSFGGRCARFTIIRRRGKKPRADGNLVEERSRLMFREFAPDPLSLSPRSGAVVGIPRAFTVHSFFPLYAWFFHDLGVRTVLSGENLRDGVQRAESAYCFPGEIAHGMTADLARSGVDFFFLPHVKNLESMEEDIHATLCPITQGLPYYLRPAFNIPDQKILRPIIDFRDGGESAARGFEELAVQLGFTAGDGRRAFRTGMAQQNAFMARCRSIGAAVLDEARASGETVVALLGRSYNAFTSDANMGIPQKLASRGVRVLPYDFIPVAGEAVTPNMYWYYGQFNLKTVRVVREHPGLYLCYVSNFGCAPDSFILHFVRWFMGTKPFLVLELDSHTADAGLDTRIEAFLDIVEGYRRRSAGLKDKVFAPRYRVVNAGAGTHVLDAQGGEKIPLRDPRVRFIVPSMGTRSTEAVAAVASRFGVRAVTLPAPDLRTTQLARSVASGKECIPTLLVLGQVLQLLLREDAAAGEILVVTVPKTTGPCRTGQYGPFYERIFGDLGVENVAILYLSSDNGYSELGPGFTRLAWKGISAADSFKDMEVALDLVAADPGRAREVLDETWKRVVAALRERPGTFGRRLRETANELRALPRRGRLESLPRVLIVGEIYVRRDDFSVQELLAHLRGNGIFGKITGLGEWVGYCDWVREEWARRAAMKLPDAPGRFVRDVAGFARVKLERAVARSIEHDVRRALGPAELLPDYPHDMDAVMSTVGDFTHVDFETEATVSCLVAAEAVRTGYDGVVAIAPFACLPGRLIRAMLEPWCRERGVPFIALENDGLAYSPGTLTRLEVFSLNVLRHHAARTNGGGAGVFFNVQSVPRPPEAHAEPLDLNALSRLHRKAPDGRE